MSFERDKRMSRDWVAQGPCAFCGDEYAAHRVYDAITGRVTAGEQLDDVLVDHMVDPSDWLALVDLLGGTR